MAASGMRKGLSPFEPRLAAFLSFVVWLFSCGSAGCGAPGEPAPPSPPVPAPINDLAASQQGNGVRLVFTLPSRTITGELLEEPPAIEIFRAALQPGAKPDGKSFRLVYTIPGALSDTYTDQGKIRFTDPVAAEELAARSGLTLAYRVRTRASKKKDSGDSNTVIAALYPVAEKIVNVDAQVTQNAIELSWAVPSLPESASLAIAGYHVYRGELESAASLPSPSDLSQVQWKNPPILLAPVQTNSYRDTLFDFGKTYVYLVRSVTVVQGNASESDDSTPAIVTPRDTFPPAAPQNLVAAVLPAENGARVVDLSWSINSEADLAGYHVYRSEKQGERGQLLQPGILLTPAVRDASVKSGGRYWYTVTAVDRAGNESAPSEAVLADLTQPLP